MSPGAYSFVPGRADTIPAPGRVVLIHNGRPIAEHATEADANAAAERLFEPQTKMNRTRRYRATKDIVSLEPHYGRDRESDWLVVRGWWFVARERWTFI